MDQDIIIGLTKPWKKTKPESYKAVNRKRVAQELRESVYASTETLKLRGFFGLQSAEIKLDSLVTSDIELGATLIEKKDYRGLLVKTFNSLTDDLSDWMPPKGVELDDVDKMSAGEMSKYWPEQILNSAVVRNEDVDRDQIVNSMHDDKLKSKLMRMNMSDVKTFLISNKIMKPGQFRRTYEKAKLFEIIESATAMCRSELLESVGNFVNNLENPSRRKAINTCVVTFNVTAEVRGEASRGAGALCVIGINENESLNRVWLQIKATGVKTRKTSLTIGVCIEVMLQPKELVRMISRMVGHAGEIEPSKEDMDSISDEMWDRLATGDMLELISSEENYTAANYTDILPLMAVAGAMPHEADLLQVNSMWNYLIDIMVRKVGLSCDIIGKPELDAHLMEAMAVTIALGSYLQEQNDKSDFFIGALLWLRMADGDNKTTDVRSPAYVSRLNQVKLRKWSDKVGLAGQALMASMALKGEEGVDTVGYRYLPIYMMINGFTTGVYGVKVLSLGALVSSMLTYAVDRAREDSQMKTVLKDLGITFSNEWGGRLGLSPAITWKVDSTSCLIESQIGSILMTERGYRLSYKEAVRAATLILTESRDPAMMTYMAERNAVHIDNMRMAILDRLSAVTLMDQQQTSKLMSTMMSVIKSAEHTNSTLLRDAESHPTVTRLVQKVVDKRQANRERDIKYKEEITSTIVNVNVEDATTGAMIADSTTRGAVMARSVMRIKGDKKTIDMLNDMYGESSSVHEPVLSYAVANAGLKGSMETLLSTYSVTDPRRIILGADLSIGGDSVFSCAAAMRDDSQGPKHYKESRSLTLKLVDGIEITSTTMFEIDADKIKESIKKIVSKANAISSSVSIKEITPEELQEVEAELDNLAETVEGDRNNVAKEIVKKIESILPKEVEVDADNLVGTSGGGITKTVIGTMKRRMVKLIKTARFIEIKLVIASPVVMLDGLGIAALMVLRMADKVWEAVAAALNKVLGEEAKGGDGEMEQAESFVVKTIKRGLRLGAVAVSGVILVCLLSFRSSVTKTTKLMLKVSDRMADMMAAFVSPIIESIDRDIDERLRKVGTNTKGSLMARLLAQTHKKELAMNVQAEDGGGIEEGNQDKEASAKKSNPLTWINLKTKGLLLNVAAATQLSLRCATIVGGSLMSLTKRSAELSAILRDNISKGFQAIKHRLKLIKVIRTNKTTCSRDRRNIRTKSKRVEKVNTSFKFGSRVTRWADSAKNVVAGWIASGVMGGDVKITKRTKLEETVKKIVREGCKLDELRRWSFEERGQMEALLLARLIGSDEGELAFSMLGSERAVRSLHRGAEVVAEKLVRIHSKASEGDDSYEAEGNLAVRIISCRGCELLNIRTEGGRKPREVPSNTTGMRLVSSDVDGSGWSLSEMQSHDERGRVVFGWATKISLDGKEDTVKVVSAAHLISYGGRSSAELSSDGLACIATTHLSKERFIDMFVRIDREGEVVGSKSEADQDRNLSVFKDLSNATQLEGSNDNFVLYELEKKDYRGLSGGPISIKGADCVAIILSQLEGSELEEIDGRRRRIVVGAANMNTKNQLVVIEDLAVETCEACLQRLRVEKEKEKLSSSFKRCREVDHPKDGEVTEWESADDASRTSASTKKTRFYSDSEDDESSCNMEVRSSKGECSCDEPLLSRTIDGFKQCLWRWMSYVSKPDVSTSEKCAGSGRNHGFMVRARTPFEQLSVLADMREMADDLKLGNGCKAVVESLIKAISADKVLVIMCIDAATRTVISALLSVLEVEFRVADNLVALADMLKAASRTSRRIVINTDVKIVLSQEMGFGKPLIMEASKVASVVGIGVKQTGSSDLVKLLTLSCAMVSDRFELTLFDEDHRDDPDFCERDPESDVVQPEITDLMLIGCYKYELSDVEELWADDERKAGFSRPGCVTIIADTYDTEKQDEICELTCRRMNCRRDKTTVMSVACLAGEVAGRWLDQADLVAVVTTGETISDEYRRTSILPLTATSQDMRRCFRDVLRLYEAKTGSSGKKWVVNRAAANKVVNLSASIATNEGCNYGVQYFKREQRKQQFRVSTATKLLTACSIEGKRMIDKETFEETVNSVIGLPSGVGAELSRYKNGVLSEEAERYSIEVKDSRNLASRVISKIRTRAALTTATLASKVKSSVSKLKRVIENKKKQVFKWVSSKVPDRMIKIIKWVKIGLTKRNAEMKKTRGGRCSRRSRPADDCLVLKNRFDPLISIWVKEAEAGRGMATAGSDGEVVENGYEAGVEKNLSKTYSRPGRQTDTKKKKNRKNKTTKKRKKSKRAIGSSSVETLLSASKVLGAALTNVARRASSTRVSLVDKCKQLVADAKSEIKCWFSKICAVVKSIRARLTSWMQRNTNKKTAGYGAFEKEGSSKAKRWSKTMLKLLATATWLEIDYAAEPSRNADEILAVKIAGLIGLAAAQEALSKIASLISESAADLISDLTDLAVAVAAVVDISARVTNCEVVISAGIMKFRLGNGGLEAIESAIKGAMSKFNKMVETSPEAKATIGGVVSVKYVSNSLARRGKANKLRRTSSLVRKFCDPGATLDANDVTQGGQILVKTYTWLKRKVFSWKVRAVLKKIWIMIGSRAEFKGPTGVIKLSKCHSSPQQTTLAAAAGALVIGVGLLAREIAGTDAAVVGALAERKHTADNINNFMKHAIVYARMTRLMTAAMCIITLYRSEGPVKLVAAAAGGALALEWAKANKDEVGVWYGLIDVISRIVACGASKRLVTTTLAAWWCDPSDSSLAVSTILLTSSRDRRDVSAPGNFERADVVRITSVRRCGNGPTTEESKMLDRVKGMNKREIKAIGKLFKREEPLKVCLRESLKEMKGEKGSEEVDQIEELEEQGKLDLSAGSEMVDFWRVAGRTAVEDWELTEGQKETEKAERVQAMQISEVFSNQCRYVGRMEVSRRNELDIHRPDDTSRQQSAVFWDEELWEGVIDVKERSEWKAAGDGRMDVLLAIAERNDKQPVFPSSERVISDYCINLYRWVEDNLVGKIGVIDARLGAPDWGVTINTVNRKATSGILTRARTGCTIAASYLPKHTLNVLGAKLANIAGRMHVTTKMVNVFAKRRIEKAKRGSVVNRKYVITRTIQAHETDLKLAVSDFFCVLDKTIKLTRRRTGVMVGMSMFREFAQDDWTTRIRSARIARDCGAVMVRVAIDHSSYDANQRMWAIEAVKEIRKMIISKCVPGKMKRRAMINTLEAIYEELSLKWLITASGDVFLVSGQQMSGHATTSSDNSLRALGYALTCADLIERKGEIEIIKESIRVQGDDTKFDVMVTGSEVMDCEEVVAASVKNAMRLMGQDVKQEKTEIRSCTESCKFLSHYSERKTMIVTKTVNKVTRRFLVSVEVPMRSREEIVAMIASSLQTGTKRKTKKEAQLLAAKAASFLVMYCGDAAIANMAAVVLRVANAILTTFDQGRVKKLTVPLDKLPWLIRQAPIVGEFCVDIRDILGMHNIGNKELGYSPDAWIVDKDKSTIKALEASKRFINNAIEGLKALNLRRDKELMTHARKIERLLTSEYDELKVEDVQRLVMVNDTLPMLSITEDSVGYKPMNDLAEKIKRAESDGRRGADLTAEVIKLTDECERSRGDSKIERIRRERELIGACDDDGEELREVKSKEGIRIVLSGAKLIRTDERNVITVVDHEEMMAVIDCSSSVSNIIRPREVLNLCISKMKLNKRSLLNFINPRDKIVPIEMLAAVEVRGTVKQIAAERDEAVEELERRDCCIKRAIYDLIETQARNYVEIY